jgi:hypothetical protein
MKNILLLLLFLAGCSSRPVRNGELQKVPQEYHKTFGELKEGETACVIIFFLKDGTPVILHKEQKLVSCLSPLTDTITISKGVALGRLGVLSPWAIQYTGYTHLDEDMTVVYLEK